MRSGCSAIETHFMKLQMNSYCADVASRGSLELDSECCNRGQIFTCFSTRWSCSLRLCAPRWFYVTVTALSWPGSSSRAEIWCWEGGILWRCHVESERFSTGHSTVCQWRLHGCVLVKFFKKKGFIHLSATGVAEIAKSTNFKGLPCRACLTNRQLWTEPFPSYLWTHRSYFQILSLKQKSETHKRW